MDPLHSLVIAGMVGVGIVQAVRHRRRVVRAAAAGLGISTVSLRGPVGHTIVRLRPSLRISVRPARPWLALPGHLVLRERYTFLKAPKFKTGDAYFDSRIGLRGDYDWLAATFDERARQVTLALLSEHFEVMIAGSELRIHFGRDLQWGAAAVEHVARRAVELVEFLSQSRTVSLSLRRIAESDGLPRVRANALRRLIARRDPGLMGALQSGVNDEDPEVRLLAATQLASEPDVILSLADVAPLHELEPLLATDRFREMLRMARAGDTPAFKELVALIATTLAEVRTGGLSLVEPEDGHLALADGPGSLSPVSE